MPRLSAQLRGGRPLITGAHHDEVTSCPDAGLAEGATIAVDGCERPVTSGYIPDGFWLGMSGYDDEIFGPALFGGTHAYGEEGVKKSAPCGDERSQECTSFTVAPWPWHGK